MNKSNSTEEEVLSYLTEYLISSLDELTQTGYSDEFIKGETTAYVDCLEVLSRWRGFKVYGIANIEKKYRIE